MDATAGKLSTGSNTRLKNSQITHISPTSSEGTTTTFNFSWEAPSTITPVTFNAVGNAVNGNNNADSADQWNSMSPVTISGAFPASLNDIYKNNNTCYPNPAIDYLIAKDISKQA